MIDQNLALFQFCDSNFPTGAFSHSFGLESYIQEGTVHDRASFSDWLHVYLHEQLVYADGLAARLVYDWLTQEDIEQIWRLDKLLHVQSFAKEVRDGTKMMGDRMLRTAAALYDIPILTVYRDKIEQEHCHGHPAIAFALIGHFLGVDQRTMIRYYLYSSLVSLVQNAVRAIPLGQTDGQKIIVQFQAEISKAIATITGLTEDDLGVVSPGLELAQMRHERVNIRIFMS
jgi:urease accessory protein